MTETPPASHAPGAITDAKPGAKPRKTIHRVCIQCNNMFAVTPENFEDKHCPNCHKGG